MITFAVSTLKSVFCSASNIFMAFSKWRLKLELIASSHFSFFAVSNISPDTWGGNSMN